MENWPNLALKSAQPDRKIVHAFGFKFGTACLKYSHLFNIAYILFDLFNLQPKKSNDHF